MLEGSALAPWIGDLDSVLNAVHGFLGDEMESPIQSGAGDVHTILFTDVEGSTALTERLGDEKTRGLLREHERITREALNAHGGSEIKTMGDGFMASFSSATGALECAVALQRAFGERNESAREPIRGRR
jgi:class 3 adenylate cyclase